MELASKNQQKYIKAPLFFNTLKTYQIGLTAFYVYIKYIPSLDHIKIQKTEPAWKIKVYTKLLVETASEHTLDNLTEE